MEKTIRILQETHAARYYAATESTHVYHSCHELLASFENDWLAQVLSFFRLSPSLAMSAVSRKARVYAALDNVRANKVLLPIDHTHEVLRYDVGTRGNKYDPRKVMELSAWWFARCALTVRARGAAALREVLNAPPQVSSKLRALSLHDSGVVSTGIDAALLQQLEEVDVSESSSFFSLASPATMQRLCTLSIENCSKSTLRGVWQLPGLTKLCIQSERIKALDMAAFECAASLRTLHIDFAMMEELEGLLYCTSLSRLKVCRCRRLRLLAQVTGAPFLRVLEAACTQINSVDDLNTCQFLESVDFIDCAVLQDLASLAGAPRLRRINASYSAVGSIAGLSMCVHLECVQFGECAELRSLAPLAGAPRLRTVQAWHSSVSNIDGLDRCPCLECVDFNGCKGLKSLAPLAGAPMLHTVLACDTGVSSVAGLNTCPLLCFFGIRAGAALYDLAPLAGAPTLQRIEASQSGVGSIDGLNTCPLLEYADFSSCRKLTSLHPLAGAPKLRVISADQSAVTNVEGLNWCPSLEHVTVRDCLNLWNLSPLRGAPRLKKVAISRSSLACPGVPCVVD